MVGGAIRSKLIHRMRYRASVLHQLWTKRGEKNTAREFCALTTPSLLSRGTREKRGETQEHRQECLCHSGRASGAKPPHAKLTLLLRESVSGARSIELKT